HTWGAARPDGDAAEGRESGALQWQSKAALATESLGMAEALVEAASAAFRTVERVASVLVVNPSSFTRADLVTVLLPEERRLAVVDAESQSRIPHAFGPPETARNRPRGVPLSFVAHDVPALGYRCFDLVVERVSTAVEERVTLAGGWAETTLRLVRGLPRLDVSVRLTKSPTTEKESVFVVFPFALDDAHVRYELTGGVGGGARVPGGAEH